MSSTRHSAVGSPLSYERYMSSPEFVELRGIPGSAVAAKAQLYSDPSKRNLLFFIQSLSLKAGGLQRVAGGACKERTQDRPLQGRDAVDLRRLVAEICVNPRQPIEFSRERSESSQSGSAKSLRQFCDALREFQRQYQRASRSNFVETSIGKEVREGLDHALAVGKMIVIEGASGSGKTTAAEAWCDEHQGQARLVSLSGITHKTGFFQKVASEIGLGTSNRKASEMQMKVEEFFRKTRLMLVIDEAHYLWPQHERVYSTPELINWVNTALVNHKVPVALICTDQFAKLKARVEKQTGWTSEQLEHRVSRYQKLSSLPTRVDLEAVAAKGLRMGWSDAENAWIARGPLPPPDFVKLVVGYALTCKMRLPAVADTIDEARYQARLEQRRQVAAKDIQKAILAYRIPSDGALRQAFQQRSRGTTFASG